MPASSLILLSLLAAQESPERAVPDVNDVVSAMLQKDADRRSAFEGYTGTRTYVLENAAYHKRAEMTVRIICQRDGTKQFEVLSASGWGGARKQVFSKLLEAEATASKPGSGDDSRVTPENYSFRMLGLGEIDDRAAYELEVTPKLPKKYLIRGKIWVDAADYAIVRMEGSPAKSPSFFIKNVKFTHRYQKCGALWLPASDISFTDARIFGPTQVTILYRDYLMGSTGNPLRASAESNNQ
jgi:outer membrane lipoprotein-sorting protein